MSDPSWLYIKISAQYFPVIQILETQPRKPKSALHVVSSAAKAFLDQDLGQRVPVLAFPNSNLNQSS